LILHTFVVICIYTIYLMVIPFIVHNLQATFSGLHLELIGYSKCNPLINIY